MPGPPPGGAAAGSCFFMSSMAPAVWYRRGSFCRGSGRPDRPDFEAGAGAAAAAVAESSNSAGSGEASEAPRVSQLSPEGDGGMPRDRVGEDTLDMYLRYRYTRDRL